MLPMCYDTSVILVTSTVSSMSCEGGINEIIHHLGIWFYCFNRHDGCIC